MDRGILYTSARGTSNISLKLFFNVFTNIKKQFFIPYTTYELNGNWQLTIVHFNWNGKRGQSPNICIGNIREVFFKCLPNGKDLLIHVTMGKSTTMIDGQNGYSVFIKRIYLFIPLREK